MNMKSLALQFCLNASSDYDLKQSRLEIFTFENQINTRGGRNGVVLGYFHIIDEILAVTSSSDDFTSTDSILIDLLKRRCLSTVLKHIIIVF